MWWLLIMFSSKTTILEYALGQKPDLVLNRDIWLVITTSWWLGINRNMIVFSSPNAPQQWEPPALRSLSWFAYKLSPPFWRLGSNSCWIIVPLYCRISGWHFLSAKPAFLLKPIFLVEPAPVNRPEQILNSQLCLAKSKPRCSYTAWYHKLRPGPSTIVFPWENAAFLSKLAGTNLHVLCRLWIGPKSFATQLESSG